MPRKLLKRPGAVFVSYVTNGAADVPRWVKKVLRPLLDERLPHSGLEGPVFLDEDSIPRGGDWERVLQDALREAAVLVPVFTPQYFDRPWCQAEFLTMLRRQQRLGFTDEARRLQLALDAERWTRLKTHRDAPKAFVDRIDELCTALSGAVRAAPEDPEWEFVVPLEDPPNFLVKPGYGGEP